MMFSDFLKKELVVLDGAMGTMLQRAGLRPGEMPENWNLSRPEVVIDIHRRYYDAGSNVIGTNTFGANLLKYSKGDLRRTVEAAFANAFAARESSAGGQKKFVALDIGPTGKLLKPFGDLDFEEAVKIFAQSVRLGVSCGADLILIETMGDSLETKAALLAAKENSSLPVLVSCAYGSDGRMMNGSTPEAMAVMLDAMGADAIGANCSLGPRELCNVVERILACTSRPVLFKPNAGLPREENGKTIFDVTPVEFAAEIKTAVEKGVRIVGGCCGSSPEFICKTVAAVGGLKPCEAARKNSTVISSRTRTVEFGNEPILIGERINPTGKKRLKQALAERDVAYVLDEGIRQCACGAAVLDVNAGMPGIDEGEVLELLVRELQNVVDVPLQIDTSSPEAMERALRIYNGKALINSVSGKQESMELVFPLVKKYGGSVIALTLDENGIPGTVEGRVEIARRIVETAKRYGIDRRDIIFDTLTMAVSADAHAAEITLGALSRIRDELGCCTSLGVSNVSFGLPSRDTVNSVFFAMALERGLSAAIMNPFSQAMMKTYHAFRALAAKDANCAGYIAAASSFQETSVTVPPGVASPASADSKTLRGAIACGLCDRAAELAAKLLLENVAPIDIVRGEIVPALDAVGSGFEAKRVYLPQLLMSAEAAKHAFEQIKAAVVGNGSAEGADVEIVVATVKGDIHDIGKNIVKMMLENYGFAVADLGKDVAAGEIVDYVVKHKVPLVGLSALMTTTVPAMEETIALLRKEAPGCKVVVGGAVLNAEYARRIGSDAYAADAMEAVRFAEGVLRSGDRQP